MAKKKTEEGQDEALEPVAQPQLSPLAQEVARLTNLVFETPEPGQRASVLRYAWHRNLSITDHSILKNVYRQTFHSDVGGCVSCALRNLQELREFYKV